MNYNGEFAIGDIVIDGPTFDMIESLSRGTSQMVKTPIIDRSLAIDEFVSVAFPLEHHEWELLE